MRIEPMTTLIVGLVVAIVSRSATTVEVDVGAGRVPAGDLVPR